MTDINKFETSREEAPTLPEAAPTQSEVVQGIGEAARFAAGWQDLDADRLRAIFRAGFTRAQVHSDRSR